jgi:hypothetical protein
MRVYTARPVFLDFDDDFLESHAAEISFKMFQIGNTLVE